MTDWVDARAWPPLDQGTLRERLAMARDQHALAVSWALGKTGTMIWATKTFEEYSVWHGRCVAWYAEMLQQLDALESFAERLVQRNGDLRWALARPSGDARDLRLALSDLLDAGDGYAEGSDAEEAWRDDLMVKQARKVLAETRLAQPVPPEPDWRLLDVLQTSEDDKRRIQDGHHADWHRDNPDRACEYTQPASEGKAAASS